MSFVLPTLQRPVGLPEARPEMGEGCVASAGQRTDSAAAHYAERKETEPAQAQMETETEGSLMAVCLCLPEQSQWTAEGQGHLR